MKILILCTLMFMLTTSGMCSNLRNSPKYLDNVVYTKSIPITMKNHHTQQRFKEVETSVPTNLESPQIVPSLGYGPRYNVERSVARTMNQQLDNTQVFDVLYKDHKDYYSKDKKFFVLDNHFQETEEFLVNKFSKAIKEGVNWDPSLKHVDNYKKPTNNISITNVPSYHPEAVKTSLNYGDMAKDKVGVLRATSDPYNQIFGAYA